MNETAIAPPQSDWPLLRLELPPMADDEAMGRLAQAAVDAGALGSCLEGQAMVICLPRADDARTRRDVLEALRAEAQALGWPGAAPSEERLPDAPWATAWKDRFKTFALGRRFLIRPDWEIETPAPAAWGDRLTVWIRPGQGFGTGHHETTRLAFVALEEALVPGEPVLDFGTGSGILAFAAARLGAGRSVGIDVDPQALINARENLTLNALEGRVELLEAGRPEASGGMFSLIVCNMLPQEALPLLEAMAQLLGGDNSRLIYTGFLADQENEVLAAMNRAGLQSTRTFSDGEWNGVLAVPKDSFV